jgi:hypothetical protein
MESTGSRGRIHISQSTADLISAAGKAHWIQPREDLVKAKGKGTMQTYWLNNSSKGSSVASNESVVSPQKSPVKDCAKEERLVQWMVELLTEHMRKIVSDHRAVNSRATISSFSSISLENSVYIDLQTWNRT